MASQASLFGEEAVSTMPARKKKKVTGKVTKKTAKKAPARKTAARKTGTKKTASRPSAAGGARRRKGDTKAHELAASAREISVSEFFAKNRHLLGFDSPRKALLTGVKEAVDNSARRVRGGGDPPRAPRSRIRAMEGEEKRYTMIVEDNGPGIVRRRRSRTSSASCSTARSSTGCGRAAASRASASRPQGMYGQLTTGNAVSRDLADGAPAPGAPLRDPR